ncbi:MAG: hypothetical protein IPF92_30125 [Myxococcales bacterium]|nr:hypothetical protein [Myxococcales bacterium]
MRFSWGASVVVTSLLAACASAELEGEPSSLEDAGALPTQDAPRPADSGRDAERDPDSGAGPDAGPDAERDADSGALVDGCPAEMARIGGFCVDRYEATVVTVEGGEERARSPYETLGDASVRAKSAPDVVPQGYISQVEAAAACAAADKRLCGAEELARACRGDDAGALYPYGGTTRMPGKCNEGKGSFVPRLFGANPALWTYENFNDPRLNQLDGGLARTGAHPECRSPHGVRLRGQPPRVDLRAGRRAGSRALSRRLLRRRRDQREGVPGRHLGASSRRTTTTSTGFRCCRDAR